MRIRRSAKGRLLFPGLSTGERSYQFEWLGAFDAEAHLLKRPNRDGDAAFCVPFRLWHFVRPPLVGRVRDDNDAAMLDFEIVFSFTLPRTEPKPPCAAERDRDNRRPFVHTRRAVSMSSDVVSQRGVIFSAITRAQRQLRSPCLEPSVIPHADWESAGPVSPKWPTRFHCLRRTCRTSSNPVESPEPPTKIR